MKDCEKYQELISAMLDGEISAAEREELEAHVAGCADCAFVYSAFSALSEGLSHALEEPPERLRENVMAELRRDEIKKSSRRLSRPLKTLLAAAACMALAVGFWALGPGAAQKTEDSLLDAGQAAPAAEAPAVRNSAADEALPADEGDGAADSAAGPQSAGFMLQSAGEDDASPSEELSLENTGLEELQDFLSGRDSGLSKTETVQEPRWRLRLSGEESLIELYVYEGELYYSVEDSDTLYISALSPEDMELALLEERIS